MRTLTRLYHLWKIRRWIRPEHRAIIDKMLRATNRRALLIYSGVDPSGLNDQQVEEVLRKFRNEIK